MRTYREEEDNVLTSMYYYQHYRPYMIKPADASNRSDAIAKKQIVTENKEKPAEVALNKSLNSDVINYAKGIYSNVTDLKYTSKKIAGDVRNYSKYKDYPEFDQDVFEEHFEKDLESFASSYNSSRKFLKGQQHSPYLAEVAGSLEKVVDDSAKVLSAMGMKRGKNGDIIINRAEEESFWKTGDVKQKTEDAEKLFSAMSEEATEVLNNPMAKHMNFKSLNYYYNYQVDKVQVDSFQIIKTGLLVNLAL